MSSFIDRSSPPHTSRDSLEDALEALHTASRTSAKQRTVKVSETVDVICRYAIHHGLDVESLREVVQLVSVKTHLDQTSVTTLVKNLYPAQRVPADVVVLVVGALGQGKGKPSPGTQDSLVKWLTAVHQVTDSPSVLSRLYGVLFGMLDMISIRTSLCHLLSLITRRKHVKPFRIQQILELSRGLGNEPALQGLLRVFKDYYPDIILGSTSTSRKSFAPQPDAEWRTRVSAILDARTTADDTLADRHNGFKVLRALKSKASAIPDVHTFHSTEASTTLEGIDTVYGLVEKLDRIEPPGQMVAILKDPLLQKYAELKPSLIVSTRIDLWLSTCLEDVFENEQVGASDPQYLGEVLAGLYTHAQYTKVLHPTVIAFLKAYMPVWNARDNQEIVLDILCLVPFDSFDDAYATYFSRVEEALVSSEGPSAYAKVVDFYTSVLQQRMCRAAFEDTHRSEPAQSKPDRVVVTEAIGNLAAHVSTLSTSLLVSLSEGVGQALVSSILAFYELLSAAARLEIVLILLPSMHPVYLMSQHASPTALSRICGIISSYKLAFDHHPKPLKNYYSTDVTDTFNCCLRDLYNLVWVHHAFQIKAQKSAGLYCHKELGPKLNEYLIGIERQYTFGSAFMLSNNAWLASLSATAWRAMEEREIEREGFDRDNIRYHQGPVTSDSLKVLNRNGGVSADWDGSNGYKVFVLNWLAERGLEGVRNLMFAIVTDLRGYK